MTALVGPLRRVWFNDHRPRYYDLPRDTLDPRYTACPAHHPACDCREASMAESLAEHIAEKDDLLSALIEATAGHPTWAYSRDGLHRDESAGCQCQICPIRRKLHVGYWEWREARAAADRELYPDMEVPF